MNLSDIKAAIAEACGESRRQPAGVNLVAVSKLQPLEKIETLLKQGHRIFGENRVQEAKEKFPDLRARYPDIELHLIGHLQKNKVKDAVKIFDVIETVDSTELAEVLNDEMEKQKRRLPCFIQVNTGEEAQKGGITPAELPALLDFCRAKTKLNITGLMCIPPVDDIPDLHFALLHKLAGEHKLSELSMGMSADFGRAIRYGTTYIRLGSAIFGSRIS